MLPLTNEAMYLNIYSSFFIDSVGCIFGPLPQLLIDVLALFWGPDLKVVLIPGLLHVMSQFPSGLSRHDGESIR